MGDARGRCPVLQANRTQPRRCHGTFSQPRPTNRTGPPRSLSSSARWLGYELARHPTSPARSIPLHAASASLAPPIHWPPAGLPRPNVCGEPAHPHRARHTRLRTALQAPSCTKLRPLRAHMS